MYIWTNQNLGSEKPFREQHKNAEISTKMWSDFVALALCYERICRGGDHENCHFFPRKKHGYNWVSKDFAEEASFSIYASKQKFVKSSVLHFHDFSPPPLPWTEGQWCNFKMFFVFSLLLLSLIAFQAWSRITKMVRNSEFQILSIPSSICSLGNWFLNFCLPPCLHILWPFSWTFGQAYQPLNLEK